MAGNRVRLDWEKKQNLSRKIWIWILVLPQPCYMYIMLLLYASKLFSPELQDDCFNP